MITALHSWLRTWPSNICAVVLVTALTVTSARAVDSLSPQVVSPAKATNTNQDVEIQSELDKMSIREKVGQLFMFGFKGTAADEALLKTISRLRPGGIIVFGRNIVSARQIATLIQEAQRQSIRTTSERLLVAVDHEGGNVIRIKTKVPLPSAMALGTLQNPELTRLAGIEAGKILSALGFNMNLAPVLDLSPIGKHSFIGTRTFGSSPTLVANLISEYSLGLSQQNVLPTAKHFPGHGDTLEDSHLTTPVRDISLTELLNRDLIPYQKFSRDFPDSAIMLGHVLYPKIDPSYPATYSRKIVTSLLRQTMAYQGLVITDDLEMAGASQFATVGARAVQAIIAGADICMIGWNPHAQRDAVRAVLQAVKNNTISIQRINQSVARILSAKHRPIIDQTEPQISRVVAAVDNYNHSAVADRVLDKIIDQNIAKLKRENFHPSAKKLVIISASQGFANALEASVSKSTYRSVTSYPMSTYSVDRLKRAIANADDADLVLLVSGAQSAQVAVALAEVAPKKLVIVNTESEGIFGSTIAARASINIYFKHPALGAQIGKMLSSLSKHVALAKNSSDIIQAKQNSDEFNAD